MRSFKGIICHDISEFESYMPSHAVGSLWGDGDPKRLAAFCGPRARRKSAATCGAALNDAPSYRVAEELIINLKTAKALGLTIPLPLIGGSTVPLEIESSDE